MNVKYLAACCCAIVVIFCGSGLADEHADVIDFDVPHQVIDNFGASDAWTMKGVGTWSEENKNKIADLLFSTDRGIGLSLWRFNIAEAPIALPSASRIDHPAGHAAD